MIVRDTPLAGLHVVETSPRADARGAFTRLFCDDALAVVLGSRKIVQVNHSRTVSRGAVRGLHYQVAPHAEMKLVRCLRGRVLDVALDLRAESPTFLQWFGQELSAENALMMVIPEGFAHGFQVLEPESELLYLHTAAYAPHAEAGVRHNDPRITLSWPLPVTEISARDLSHPSLSPVFDGLRA